MLIGIELVSDLGGAATAMLCDRVLYGCMEAGLSFKVSDGRVLTLTPPLNVREAELAAAADILCDVIARSTTPFPAPFDSHIATPQARGAHQ